MAETLNTPIPSAVKRLQTQNANEVLQSSSCPGSSPPINQSVNLAGLPPVCVEGGDGGEVSLRLSPTPRRHQLAASSKSVPITAASEEGSPAVNHRRNRPSGGSGRRQKRLADADEGNVHETTTGAMSSHSEGSTLRRSQSRTRPLQRRGPLSPPPPPWQSEQTNDKETRQTAGTTDQPGNTPRRALPSAPRHSATGWKAPQSIGAGLIRNITGRKSPPASPPPLSRSHYTSYRYGAA